MWSLIPAVFCLGYFIVILLYGGITTSFAWFWLMLCAAFVLSAHSTAGRVFLPLTCTGLLILSAFAVYIITGMHAEPGADAEYILVEGCQVKGTEPSRSLQRRLEKAVTAADENPHAVLILSGGRGPGEEITEAECMFRFLELQGIDPARMVKEERSTSTYENLVFSDELTGCAGASVWLVSSNFHMRRSLYLAEKAGYTHAAGMGASSDPVLQVHFIVREAAAMCYYMLRDYAAG